MRLVFLTPRSEHPVGGTKVLYKHAEAIFRLGEESYIYHPPRRHTKKLFSIFNKLLRRKPDLLPAKHSGVDFKWFDHQAQLRPPIRFDPQVDFLVIPEIWADIYGTYALENGFRFAIYVQNGYLVYPQGGNQEGQKLSKVFDAATAICSVSEDTTKFLQHAFPSTEHKIIRILPYLDTSLFCERGLARENIICYMPRKLESHAHKLLFLLRNTLPIDWKIFPISNATERSVSDILSRSKIFLSFSEFEGFGLPPLEAALCGNRVIGYTGEGGREFFEEPIFTAIEHGNLLQFQRSVTQASTFLDNPDQSDCYIRKSGELRNKLARRYGESEQLRHLQSFVSYIKAQN